MFVSQTFDGTVPRSLMTSSFNWLVVFSSSLLVSLKCPSLSIILSHKTELPEHRSFISFEARARLLNWFNWSFRYAGKRTIRLEDSMVWHCRITSEVLSSPGFGLGGRTVWERGLRVSTNPENRNVSHVSNVSSSSSILPSG